MTDRGNRWIYQERQIEGDRETERHETETETERLRQRE